MQGNLLPEIAYTSTLLVVSEEVMPDVERNQIKKSIKRKKYPYIVNVLKKSLGATIITKHIFDFRINFTIDKLLASIPAIKKQFRKAIFKDEAV